MHLQYEYNLGRVMLAVAISSIAACAGDLGSADAQEAASRDVAAQSYELTGERSAALGVARWSVEGDQFRALDASSQEIARLRLDQPSRTIESLAPELGRLDLRDQNANTFGERSQQLFDALKADLQVKTEAEPREELRAENSNTAAAAWVQLACFYTNASCIAAGQQLLFAGQVQDYRCTYFDTVCGSNSLLEVLLP